MDSINSANAEFIEQNKTTLCASSKEKPWNNIMGLHNLYDLYASQIYPFFDTIIARLHDEPIVIGDTVFRCSDLENDPNVPAAGNISGQFVSLGKKLFEIIRNEVNECCPDLSEEEKKAKIIEIARSLFKLFEQKYLVNFATDPKYWISPQNLSSFDNITVDVKSGRTTMKCTHSLKYYQVDEDDDRHAIHTGTNIFRRDEVVVEVGHDPDSVPVVASADVIFSTEDMADKTPDSKGVRTFHYQRPVAPMAAAA